MKNKVKSFKDLAEDVYMLINERFPFAEDYFVFGHNIGANVGMHLAIAHPEKVKGLTLLSPIPPDGLKESIDVKTIDDLKKYK